MSKLKENATKFRDALAIQRDRLAVAKWLHSIEDSSHTCPLCESPLPEHSPRLAQLLQSLTDIEVEVRGAGAIPASFDREMLRAKEELQLHVEKLKGISVRKQEVEARSEHARQTRFRESERNRFLGRVESGLEMHEALGDEGIHETSRMRGVPNHLTRLVTRPQEIQPPC